MGIEGIEILTGNPNREEKIRLLMARQNITYSQAEDLLNRKEKFEKLREGKKAE